MADLYFTIFRVLINGFHLFKEESGFLFLSWIMYELHAALQSVVFCVERWVGSEVIMHLKEEEQ